MIEKGIAGKVTSGCNCLTNHLIRSSSSSSVLGTSLWLWRVGWGQVRTARSLDQCAAVVVVSREFVEAVFQENRDKFGPKRKSGARRIAESTFGLHALRRLRVNALGG